MTPMMANAPNVTTPMIILFDMEID
jgi:hypothetical protein